MANGTTPFFPRNCSVEAFILCQILTVKLAAFMSIRGRRVLALMLLVSWMEREPPLELEEPIGLGQETITKVTITRASQDSTRRLIFIRFPPKNHFGESTEGVCKDSRSHK